ncbi:hypothetical protein PS3A_41240 [Pseudomonas sp. 3A(2025)]
MGHQNLVDTDTVKTGECRHGLAAAVHVGGGDQQTNILTLMRIAPGQAKEFALGDETDPFGRSNTLNEKSPCVMPGLFVFGAWISQTNDQFYGAHDRGSSLELWMTSATLACDVIRATRHYRVTGTSKNYLRGHRCVKNRLKMLIYNS